MTGKEAVEILDEAAARLGLKARGIEGPALTYLDMQLCELYGQTQELEELFTKYGFGTREYYEVFVKVVINSNE